MHYFFLSLYQSISKYIKVYQSISKKKEIQNLILNIKYDGK